jgi:hypothetical protein
MIPEKFLFFFLAPVEEDEAILGVIIMRCIHPSIGKQRVLHTARLDSCNAATHGLTLVISIAV